MEEHTIFAIIGLDSLPSYPTRIGPLLKNEAKDKQTSDTKSKVKSSPNFPRIPFVPNSFANVDSVNNR